MKDATQQGFWLANLLYGEDNDIVFFNASHIITVEPIMDEEIITGYCVRTIDDEEYEVKFKTGPFARITNIQNAAMPLFGIV